MDRGEILFTEKQISARDREAQRLVSEFRGSDEESLLEDFAFKEIVGKGRDYYEQGNNLNSVSGYVFEQMALNYYYNTLTQNKDNESLAVFLKSLLDEPNTRVVSYYEDKGLDFGNNEQESVVENTDELRSSTLFPSDSRAKNPDGLLVDIKTDENTGKKVAVIIGAIDAKINGKISSEQLEGFKESLWKLVKGLKSEYKNLVNQLDLDSALPEEIDIVPIEKMGIKILRPQGFPNEDFSQKIDENKGIFLPITRNEINTLASQSVDKAKKRYDQFKKKYGEPFRLKVSTEALKKYDENGEAQRFIDVWKTPDHVKDIVFKASGDSVKEISLILKDGEVFSIPAHLFRSVFWGAIDVNPNGDPKGIYLRTENGKTAHIIPSTPEGMAKFGQSWENLVKRIAIHGALLPDDINVRMVKE